MTEAHLGENCQIRYTSVLDQEKCILADVADLINWTAYLARCDKSNQNAVVNVFSFLFFKIQYFSVLIYINNTEL